MSHLLQINSSIHAGNGQSTNFADRFTMAWRARHPDAEVSVRDLAAQPVPHLTAERFAAFLSKPGERSLEQQAVVNYSDALIEQWRRADVIVLGLPMYNYGLPSALQSYFDHIARAGVTFRYTEKGPVGLLTGKKVYVFATRGGVHAGTARDTQSGHLRDFLALLGITDVEFVYAEGFALGEAQKQAALAQAHAAIARLDAPQLRAA